MVKNAIFKICGDLLSWAAKENEGLTNQVQESLNLWPAELSIGKADIFKKTKCVNKYVNYSIYFN